MTGSPGMATDLSAEEVDDSKAQVMQLRRRHRQSIAKAAEVLESAGMDTDCGQGGASLLANLELVQTAMESARRRHRRSVVMAAQQLEEPCSAPYSSECVPVIDAVGCRLHSPPSNLNANSGAGEPNMSMPPPASDPEAKAFVYEPQTSFASHFGMEQQTLEGTKLEDMEPDTSDAAPDTRRNHGTSAAYSHRSYSEAKALGESTEGRQPTQSPCTSSVEGGSGIGLDSSSGIVAKKVDACWAAENKISGPPPRRRPGALGSA